jgi:uncharacterized protein YbcV (DUF1398 family)
MDYLKTVEEFTKQLQGRTCTTSRIKEKQVNGYFCTLHSLVYKVLRKSSSDNEVVQLKKRLSGEETFENVQHATASIKGIYSTRETLRYYYSLRAHQNYGTNISVLEGGTDLLNDYQAIKKDTMDWEESMQLATWYLKNDVVYSIEKFNFDNLVLLRPELLNQARNKNTLDFFKALSEWSSRHKKMNIYYVTSKGKAYIYTNGKYETTKIRSKDDCQWQSSFLVR